MSAILNISGSRCFKDIFYTLYPLEAPKKWFLYNLMIEAIRVNTFQLPSLKNKIVLVQCPPCWNLPEVGFLQTSKQYNISKSSTKQRFVPNIMVVA